MMANSTHYWHAAAPRPTPELSLAELDTALAGFVASYNARTHSELGTSPHTAWIAEGGCRACLKAWKNSTGCC